MTDDIVDVLEAIEIDQEDRNRIAQHLARRKPLLEEPVEGETVVQPGQAVMLGRVAQSHIRLKAFRNILQNAHHTGWVDSVILDPFGDDTDALLPVIGEQEVGFEIERRARADHCVERLLDRAQVIGVAARHGSFERHGFGHRAHEYRASAFGPFQLVR